jgi:hypothetical protein
VAAVYTEVPPDDALSRREEVSAVETEFHRSRYSADASLGTLSRDFTPVLVSVLGQLLLIRAGWSREMHRAGASQLRPVTGLS